MPTPRQEIAMPLLERRYYRFVENFSRHKHTVSRQASRFAAIMIAFAILSSASINTFTVQASVPYPNENMPAEERVNLLEEKKEFMLNKIEKINALIAELKS